jgi:hypothetical protein
MLQCGTMEKTAAAFLLTSEGRESLDLAENLFSQRVDTLSALTQLRRHIAPDLAAAAWSMADLRSRAVTKFGPIAAQMYFVREALEQASSRRAAKYHAVRYVRAGVTNVTDLCGGIGADALAFAESGVSVTLVELAPVRALFAAENARAHGFSDLITVVNADVTSVPIQTTAVWFDPARRVDRRRVVSPDDYQPPLSFLTDLKQQGVTEIGVKLSPGIDHQIALEYDAQLEFISDNGECKEALLWSGKLRNGRQTQAIQLTETGSIAFFGDAEPKLRSNGQYLYEPDPALIRAHLVGQLASDLEAGVLDPHIAYLVGDRFVSTPWATAYKILDHFPYHRKALQRALTERDIGRVIIKKRGFPQEPEEVRKELKLKGAHEIIVVLTRLGDKHHVFLCELA